MNTSQATSTSMICSGIESGPLPPGFLLWTDMWYWSLASYRRSNRSVLRWVIPRRRLLHWLILWSKEYGNSHVINCVISLCLISDFTAVPTPRLKILRLWFPFSHCSSRLVCALITICDNVHWIISYAVFSALRTYVLLGRNRYVAGIVLILSIVPIITNLVSVCFLSLLLRCFALTTELLVYYSL